MNWYKKAQKDKWSDFVKWFDWTEDNKTWTISYRELEEVEMYESNGKLLSNIDLMDKMVISIRYSGYDEMSLSRDQIRLLLEKMSPEDFFDKVRETNDDFLDERRIEQRDIDSGLIDLDYDRVLAVRKLRGFNPSR